MFQPVGTLVRDFNDGSFSIVQHCQTSSNIAHMSALGMALTTLVLVAAHPSSADKLVLIEGGRPASENLLSSVMCNACILSQNVRRSYLALKFWDEIDWIQRSLPLAGLENGELIHFIESAFVDSFCS